MKIVFLLLTVFATSQVALSFLFSPEVTDFPIDIDEDVWKCAIADIRSLDIQNPDIRAILEYLIETFTKLRDRYEFCDNMVVSDPPRPWEEPLKEACFNGWKANVALEVAKITAKMNEAHGEASELWEQIQEIIALCKAELNPE